MPPHPRARKGTTCLHCKNMKLRCDAATTWPSPCSRCERTGKACSQRHDALKARPSSTAGRPSVSVQQSRSESYEEPTPTSSTIQVKPTLTPGGDEVIIEAQTLEGIDCSPELFRESVDDFWEVFHPRLPFLESKETLIKDCASSRLLFWTIVSIAIRRHERYNELYLSLSWPLRRLAMERCITELVSMPNIQALLLLCVWPMPFGAIKDDPSVVFSGLATSLSLQIGLHRPNKMFDYLWVRGVDQKMINTRTRTWALCFIVNRAASARQGIPMTVRPDHALLSLPKSGDDNVAHPILRDMLALALQQHSISHLLGHDESAPDGIRPNSLPLLSTFEASAKTLEATLSPDRPLSVQRQVFMTLLVVYSFAFSISDDDWARHSPEVAAYVTKAYETSLEVIRSSLADQAGLASWTVFDFTSVQYAVMVLLFISRQHPAAVASPRHQAECRDAVQRAWALMRGCGRRENDFFQRLCDLVDWVVNTDWTADLALPDDMSRLIVRSRMEVNIVYDLIARGEARFLMGRVKRRGRQLPDKRSTRSSGTVDPSVEQPDMGSLYSFWDMLDYDWDNELTGLMSDQRAL